MSFKYINPGYSELITPTNNYEVLYSSSKGNATPSSSQSKTGVAFYNRICVILKSLPTTSGSEFWVKADVYLPRKNHFSIYCRQNYGSGFTIVNSDNSYSLRYHLGNKETSIFDEVYLTQFQEGTLLRLNSINQLWLHVVLDSDSTTGYIEFKLNNQYFGKYFGNTMPSGLNTTLRYKSFLLHDGSTDYNSTLFSNVIISDEYISPNERIVALPVGNTLTDFDTLSSGLYRADAASETLLQSVNVNSLVEQYGSDTNVTGIALIGNPAYEVDDVIGSLTALTKENDVVTEHGKISLLTDTDSMIVSSFSMASSTTIADLSNMQFGWRAEA